MHIVFCATPDYFIHAAVNISSICINNKTSPIDIHVLTCDQCPESEKLLCEAAQRFRNATIKIYHVDSRKIASLFIDRHLTKETYLRILIPDILPDCVERVLYLDGDIVVLDDLAPLWALDLDGALVAAAPDLDLDGSSARRYRNLGIDPQAFYANAGVMLMDLARWRAESSAARVLEFAAGNSDKLMFHDQDAINVALRGRIKEIDQRWNLPALSFSRKVRREAPAYFAGTAGARRHPAVIHYTSSVKPWHFRARIRRKADYFRFRAGTAWGGDRTGRLTASQAVEFKLAAALVRCGIDVYQIAHAVSAVVDGVRAATRRPVPAKARSAEPGSAVERSPASEAVPALADRDAVTAG